VPGTRGELLRYQQWNIDAESVVSFAGVAFGGDGGGLGRCRAALVNAPACPGQGAKAAGGACPGLFASGTNPKAVCTDPVIFR